MLPLSYPAAAGSSTRKHADQLGPGGVEEQRVGSRLDPAAILEQQAPEALAEPRPTGLAGQHDRPATGDEGRREALPEHRLAGALGALERDQATARLGIDDGRV